MVIIGHIFVYRICVLIRYCGLMCISLVTLVKFSFLVLFIFATRFTYRWIKIIKIDNLLLRRNGPHNNNSWCKSPNLKTLDWHIPTDYRFSFRVDSSAPFCTVSQKSSQYSVTTCKVPYEFVLANFVRFPAVQTFWKSIEIWQSYR